MHQFTEFPTFGHGVGQRQERSPRPELCRDTRNLRISSVMPAPPPSCLLGERQSCPERERIDLIVRAWLRRPRDESAQLAPSTLKLTKQLIV